MSDYDYDMAHQRNSGSGIDDDPNDPDPLDDRITPHILEKIVERQRKADLQRMSDSLSDAAQVLRDIAELGK